MKIAIVNLSNIDELEYTLENIHYIYEELIDPQIDIFIERKYNSYFEEIEVPYTIQTIIMENINILDLKLKYDSIRYYSKSKYDLAIDTQGTLKTAIITYLLSGRTAGIKFSGFKNKIISLFYDEKIDISKLTNKNDIIKKILSKPFGYTIDD